jgi:MOSC domain-containing protein YiiM
MTTLPRVDLPHDPRILRTVVQLNTLNLGDFGNLPCVGVYADVVKPGRIRRGDPVRIGD